MKQNRNKILCFGLIFVCWLLVDIATKVYFDSYSIGQLIAGPFAGLFQFTLVHNTGGAWGIFASSTLALGIFSLALCLVFVVYLFKNLSKVSMVYVVSIALIVAGGVGNALSRFISGYVVDFIEFTFISFPVFNIADIGVTCGVVLLFIALIRDLTVKEQ